MKRSSSQVWIAVYLLLAYGTSRLFFSVMNPYVYRWQYAVLDLAVVEFLLLLSYVLDRWVNR